MNRVYIRGHMITSNLYSGESISISSIIGLDVLMKLKKCCNRKH